MLWIAGKAKRSLHHALNRASLVAIRRAESDMVELNNHVLHWRPEENRWVEIAWDDFCAFREFFTPFRPLADVGSGVHYFVVCICAEEQTWNINFP